jgi:PAS domain
MTIDTSSWNPKTRAAYEHWAALRPAADRLPGRRHFDPMAVPQLLPNIVLLDVEGRPPRFRYRVVGTRMVDALGTDLTGRWLDEAHARDGEPPPQFPSYDRVVATGAPEWRRGKPHFTSYIDRCTEIERVFLPLAGNGRDVDMILAVAVFFDSAGKEV